MAETQITSDVMVFNIMSMQKISCIRWNQYFGLICTDSFY